MVGCEDTLRMTVGTTMRERSLSKPVQYLRVRELKEKRVSLIKLAMLNGTVARIKM